MITSKEMQELENKAVKRGKTILQLMDKASDGLVKAIKEKVSKENKILFICFHGNNGADGLAAARKLLKEGYKVKVYFIGEKAKLTKEARFHLNKLPKKAFIKKFVKADIIVDCIFGIGFKGRIKGKIKNIIERINSSKAFKISCDIPSGLEADTEKLTDCYVKADLVVTMHDLKPVLKNFKNVIVVDIGLQN